MAEASKMPLCCSVVLAKTSEGPEYIRLEEGPPKLEKAKTPCLLRTKELSPVLMRQIFQTIELYEASPEVPVILFRRCLRRVLDMFDPELKFDTEDFGDDTAGLKMSWADVRAGLDKGHTPKIPIGPAESIFLMFEDFQSSWLGLLWYIITNFAIVANIGIIVWASLEPSPKVTDMLDFAMSICVNLFIFDYMVKAITVTYCPIALFDQAYLLDHVIPRDATVCQSLHTTGWQRFWWWATSPSNVLDFMSILPTIINHIFVSMHLPLSALRMLRLLRVIRVLRAFKAVGKWVVTLQVLGEAFYSSLGSIMVLVLYITLFSMVAGAVLYQQEGEIVDEYSDVPVAMTFVAELFIGKSWSISTSFISALILASVGLFKGIIFLLPINKLKKASQVSEARFDELAAMRQQMDSEEVQALQPRNMSWASDLRCPAVRVRVFPEGTVSAQGMERGRTKPSTGTLNVPICRFQPFEGTIAVPLHGGPTQRSWGGRRPELEVFVRWSPGDMKSESYPRGELLIQIKDGKFFAGNTRSQWCVHLEAPEMLYGPEASADWVSPASATGSPNPEWSANTASHIFNIHWQGPESSQTTEPSSNEVFQTRVLGLLEDLTNRIAVLEHVVKDKNSETN